MEGLYLQYSSRGGVTEGLSLEKVKREIERERTHRLLSVDDLSLS